MRSVPAPGRASVTLKDLAKAAGLSRTAVSRALRDMPDIGPATRKRVKLLAGKIDYHPHEIARSLAVGRTKIIGLVLNELDNPFYGALAEKIARFVEQAGYSFLVSHVDPYDPYTTAEKAIRYLARRNADGIIAGVAPNVFYDVRGICRPLVAYGVLDKHLPGVFTDRKHGMREAVSYLVALGHTQFGLLCLQRPHPREGKQAGFRSALVRHGLPVRQEWIVPGTGTLHSGFETTKAFLRNRDLPTVFMYNNDLAAIGGMQAIQEAGLRVPEDISVVGFDNIEMGRYTFPALTTVEQPVDTIAEHVLRILFRRIDDPEYMEQTILRPELIIRNSTGVPPTDKAMRRYTGETDDAAPKGTVLEPMEVTS